MIHLNEDGSAKFEKCHGGKFEQRKNAVGHFLDGKFVICGGLAVEYKIDCNVIDDVNTKTFKMTSLGGRHSAASIKLNQSAMWITGGYDKTWFDVKLTEIVSVDGSASGINMPFGVYGHCMVQYKPDAIILIGGAVNGKMSKKTWIIDPMNGFNMTKGPNLIEGRYYHSCGKVKDKDGNVIVVTAGGTQSQSMELLNTTQMLKWTKGTFLILKMFLEINQVHTYPFCNEGPMLPYYVRDASMIQTQENKVVLVGGSVGHGTLNTIQELDINDFQWREITLPIKTLRQDHLAFAATKDQLKLFCGKLTK